MDRSFFSNYATELIIILIPFIFMNMILIYLLVKSEIFNNKRLRTFLYVVNSMFLAAFLFAYITLSPEPPRPRIAFAPIQINVDGMDSDYAFALTDQIEQNMRYIRQEKFYVHSQWWTFGTILQDKQDSIPIYTDLIKNINSDHVINGQLDKENDQFTLTISSKMLNKSYTFPTLKDFAATSASIIRDLCSVLQIPDPVRIQSYDDLELVKIKKQFYNAKYEDIIAAYKAAGEQNNYSHPNTIFWIARSFTMLGAKLK